MYPAFISKMVEEVDKCGAELLEDRRIVIEEAEKFNIICENSNRNR